MTETIEKWREPNAIDEYEGDVLQAIWYGPAGPEGDTATEIVGDYEQWEVSRYDHVGGYFNDHDPALPFLKTTTFLSKRQMEKDHGTDNYLLAVALGVDALSYWGGVEEMVANLPTIEVDNG